MLQWYEDRGRSARLTCRHFGISPDTFNRWWRRYQRAGPGALEDRSHRPGRVRQPTWSPELAQAVQELREAHPPRWGKDKLVVLLRSAGWSVSTSMAGRIPTRLRQRGVLVESPAARALAARRPRPPRPYAVRKPRDYRARKPGDIVQVDTLDLRPLPGVVYKHFTARDVVCRWDSVAVYQRATARSAASFLDGVLERMPFPVRTIQVDGGSEFKADFERACQERDICLFVLPPRLRSRAARQRRRTDRWRPPSEAKRRQRRWQWGQAEAFPSGW